MIDPRPGDEGKPVFYRPRVRVQELGRPRIESEELGLIHFWNDEYVFVRYAADARSADDWPAKATLRSDLFWEKGLGSARR